MENTVQQTALGSIAIRGLLLNRSRSAPLSDGGANELELVVLSNKPTCMEPLVFLRFLDTPPHGDSSISANSTDLNDMQPTQSWFGPVL